MRLITDMFAFCARAGAALEHDLGQRVSHPRGGRDGARRSWRSRCATASNTCSDGVDAGLDVDDVRAAASRSSSTRTATSSRRSRSTARRARIWARVMRERFGAKDERSLEAALPHPDGRRVADGAAAVQQRRPHGAAGAGGGARRHATRCTPTRSTRRWRCRRRRPRRSRCGRSRSSRTKPACTDVVDPLGGSYFVEKLTHDLEDEARGLLRRRSTGWAAWSRRSSEGFPQREIAESAYTFQQAVERARAGSSSASTTSWQDGRAADRDPVHRRDGGGTAAGTGSIELRTHARRRRGRAGAGRAARSGARAPPTRCRRSSTRVRAYARSARCATRCARSGASTRRAPII